MKQTTNVVGKASCVAHSWLSAWGVDVQFVADETHDLLVNGHRIKVARDSSGPDTLNADLLCSPSVATVLGELHRVTVSLGLGAPAGFRPENSNVTRASTEDFEAVAMRQTQFARTANPPDEVIRKFLPIVKREAQRAARRHKATFTQLQFTWEDVYQIAQVLFVNHYHQFMFQKWDHDVNCKFLVRYLQQQLERLAEVSSRKNRNISFSGAGVPLEECMSSPVEGVEMFVGYGGEAAYEPTGEVRKETKGRTVTLRKNAAKAKLEAFMANTPHEDVVSKLEEVAGNEFCDYAARRLARDLLREHRKGCQEVTCVAS